MIHLDDITSGYSTGKMNENFQKIEREFNEKTLRRDGLGHGEPNHMEVDLDMNSQDVINVGNVSAKEVFIGGAPVKKLLNDTIVAAGEEADRASDEADRADGEADRAKQEADRAERAAEDLDGPYSFLGDYGPGLVATNYGQVVRDSAGEFWRVSGQVDLPYTTTGTGLPEDDAFVPAGDAVLRQDLANPDMGALMVGSATIYTNTFSDLQGLDTADLTVGQTAVVWGSEFRWDGSEWHLVSALDVRAFGAVGDGVSDDTQAIQDALFFLSGGEDGAESAFDSTSEAGELLVQNGVFRFTDTLHVPQWVTITGNFSGAITSSGRDLMRHGSVLLADFVDENKAAISACGKWIEDGRYIDLTSEIIGASTHDGGHITRRYGVHIRDIVIYTKGDVKIGYAFAGAPCSKISNVSVVGFLNGVVGHSSWGCTITSLNIRAKHIAFFDYNMKACEISGYFSGMNYGPNTPELNDSTALPGVYGADNIHNPESIRYLTTCLYHRYSSANTYKVTLESMERGIAGFDIYSSDFNGAYIESISELPVHAVKCVYTFSAPRVYTPERKVFRLSSGGTTVVDTDLGVICEALDYGSQTSYGAAAQLRVATRDQSTVRDSEDYSPAVSFSFLRLDPLIIYVSGDGDDAATGLNQSRPVATMSIAVERARYYGAKKITVLEGGTVGSSGIVFENDDIEISGAGANSAISVADNSTWIMNNSRVKLRSLTVTKGSVDVQSSALFRLVSGFNAVEIQDCDLSGIEYMFVIQPQASTTINLNVSGATTYRDRLIGRNNYDNTGRCAVVFTISDSSLAGFPNLTWGSRYDVLNSWHEQ